MGLADSMMHDSYVRGLEQRVKELERQLSLQVVSSQQLFQRADPDSDNSIGTEFGFFHQDHDPVDFTVQTATELHARQTPASTRGQKERANSLATELERLSLEATAERHLGSSSGVSFAKLTQAVLGRLRPDKSSFVFEDDADPDPVPDDGNTPTFDSLTFPDINFLSASSPLTFNSSPVWEQLDKEQLLEPRGLPSAADVARLTDFYWAHSHTLYPIIRKYEFMQVLWQVYENPRDPIAESPLWMFRIWMVFAIGSTAYSSVSLVDESESVLFFNKAMTYFESALGCGDMVC
jgi:hypothetical protein